MSPATVVRIEVVTLSVGAALLLAVTSVLQHRATGAVPQHKSLRPGLVGDLLRHPLWLAGFATDACAYLLQFLALRRGSLVLVESLLVTGLLFALPFGAAWSRRRLSQSDWLATVAVVGGLAIFLVSATPEQGVGQPGPLGWTALLALTGLAVAGLVRWAPPGPSRGRALALAAACGVLFGLDAALTRTCALLLDRGALHLLLSWQIIALAVTAPFAFLLSQSAFQAGPLEASLPVLTITEPLVSAAIALGILHERIVTSPMAALAEGAGVVAMIAGASMLARSPLILAPRLAAAGDGRRVAVEAE